MIKLVVFDFDGVFTDGMFNFDNNNNVNKSYNAKDAYSLNILKQNNINCGIITNDKIVSIKHAPHIFDRLDKVSIGSEKPKLDIITEWIKEYNLSYKEVAYIGDDLPDIPILENVGFSGCPNDAIEDVKNISNYICKNDGGKGAVREFVDLIIKNNVKYTKPKTQSCEHYFINTTETKNDGKITAIIPVRKGSQRCKNKNIRNFGDTNLLKLKIKSLKQVKGIEEIIVSTDCHDMISIAEELNVKVHKRDEYYASSECPNYKYWTYLAENVGYCSNIMMVNVVSPLIDSNIINNFIDKFVQLKYTNMVTVNEQKSFFCNSLTTNGINFDSTKAPNSQELIPLSEITFGICIATKKQIINSRCIYGEKPVFFNVDSISGIDIDENSDFIKAELLYNENILNENTCKMILEKRSDKIELLDCTIRDGGYLNNWEFTDEEVLDCYKAASEAGYDYFEIGFRTNKKLLLNKGKWCYCIEDDINNIYQQYQGCKIVVMAKMDTVTIDDFVKKSESNISMVRVLLARVTNENGVKICKYNKNDLERTKNFCQELINYGYEVCVNFGCGDIIDECEITLIAHTFYDVNIKALYLADTYGGFNTNNIPKQLHRFYHEFDKYKSNISIGFHCHNNNGDALDKTKKAIFHGCNIIDSCIGGLGRGAGNLKSEELMSYLYTDKTKYIHKIYPLIVYFDKHILSKKEYNIKQMNHPYYKISGYISLHPDYISDILLNHNSSVEEDINLIVKLDEYTKQTNKRNYNKELICVL